MRRGPATGPEAPKGLFGVLRTWLQAGPDDTGPASQVDATPDDDTMAPAHGSVRVLVVDDDPVNLMWISGLMGRRGLVPWLAADGAEAVALACELPFDLILMDLQMPILDGLGATSAIRRHESQTARPAVPVVAYSSALPGGAVLARHGFNGSLHKPCGEQDLQDCLARWCPPHRPAPDLSDAELGVTSWRAGQRAIAAPGASLR